MNEYFTYLQTPVGRLWVAGTQTHLTRVSFSSEKFPTSQKAGTPALLGRACTELAEYFDGKRKIFDLPLAPAGTPFQKRVWQELLKIPYGQTRTYGQLAAAVNNVKASRAVGGANHVNPIAIIIPCHRVIGANGQLTGYAGGLEIKKFLLKLESGFI